MSTRLSKLLVVLGVLVLVSLGYLLVDYSSQNQALQEQIAILKKANSQQNTLPSLQELLAVPPLQSADHVNGPTAAPILLVEYADFDCPFCKQLHPVLNQLRQQYGEKVAWVYREYPLASHPHARMKAEVAECVASRGGNDAFWRFADTLFSDQSSTTLEQTVKQAAPLGLDETGLQKCAEGTPNPRIDASIAEGKQAGMTGTPTVFIFNKNSFVKGFTGAQSATVYQDVINQLLTSS